MTTTPYLHFRGDCAAALAFYQKVFAGTDLQMMRYADSPDAPAEWQDKPHVMHGELTIGNARLMASDFPPGVEGDPQKAVSVMQSAPDVATAGAWFDALCDGGDVIDGFKPTFFSPGFGMVRDRFGTHWIIAAVAGRAAGTDPDPEPDDDVFDDMPV